MKSDELLDAIGEAREEYIDDVRNITKRKITNQRLLFKKHAALAALFVMVLSLAIPVGAEFQNGYVSNLLAPLYGGAQTEIVDQIGRPVNASVTVGEYTLSANAVIGDKYHMAIVYSLTRTDGGQIEKELSFENYSNTAKRGTWGGTYRFHLSEDKTVLYIVEEWTAANRLRLNRSATATFTNLMWYDEAQDKKVLLEKGSWELKFTIRYEDSSIQIPANDTMVKDGSDKTYTIHSIIVSPIGMHMDLTAPNRTKFFAHDETPYQDFTVSLILRDGREINLEDRNIASHGDMEDDNHDANFGARFDEPIPLEQMQEIVICGISFPFSG